MAWDGRRFARGLSMPHSPRWYAGRLWVCESGTGTLGYIDPHTDGINRTDRKPQCSGRLDAGAPSSATPRNAGMLADSNSISIISSRQRSECRSCSSCQNCHNALLGSSIWRSASSAVSLSGDLTHRAGDLQ